MNIDQQWQQWNEYQQVFEQLSREFITGLNTRPVSAGSINKGPGLTFGQGLDGVEQLKSLLQNQVMPYLSGSAGPRYWGFVTGGATPVACLADWLVSVFDQNVSKGGDSIASAIERQTIQWLQELYQLSGEFKGVMTTGATAANFLGVLSFRQWAGEQCGLDVAKQEMSGLDMEIFTATPHASMLKRLGMAGVGQQQITGVPTLKNSEEIDCEQLKALMAKSQAKAKVVIASAGTVMTAGFDDLQTVASLCQQTNSWLHVDGAFGIAERLVNASPRTAGIELADSITIDNHKWLNVPYDSGTLLVRHEEYLKGACHVGAPYLNTDSQHTDFMSLGVENSRRFSAFPVWLSLLAYGRQPIKHWVEANIQQAAQLSQWIDQSQEFELVFPCTLNIVLFRPVCDRHSLPQANRYTRAVMEALNQQGQVFFSPGVWQGKQVIRAAMSNWKTTAEDIELAIASLQQCVPGSE